MNYGVFMDNLRTVLLLIYGDGYPAPPAGKDLLVSFAPTVFCGLRSPTGL